MHPLGNPKKMSIRFAQGEEQKRGCFFCKFPPPKPAVYILTKENGDQLPLCGYCRNKNHTIAQVKS